MGYFLRKVSKLLLGLFIAGILYMVVQENYLKGSMARQIGLVQYFRPTGPSNDPKTNQCGYRDYRMKEFYETYASQLEMSSDKPSDRRTTDKEMLNRYLNIEAKCPKERLDTVWSRHPYSHTLVSRAFKFSICFVPKIGCTFWKTLIHTLEKPNITSENFTSLLLHTDKNVIHAKPLPWLMGIENAPTVFRNSKLIVFSRDPYSRLLSAYNDKFLLPAFSGSIGKKVVQLFRANASEQGLNCGHDVSFEEFLRYVIYVDKTGDFYNRAMDDHYAPVTSLCNLCETKYDFIGKQETFAKDREYIFQQLGLDKLLVRNISREDSIIDSINQTVSAHMYHFRGTPCLSHDFMKDRIWRSLQLQGYVPYHTDGPWATIDSEQVNTNSLLYFLIGEYKKYAPNTTLIKKQRRQALIDAYRGVSLEVKKEIQSVFHYDFELFGYEREPFELFNN